MKKLISKLKEMKKTKLAIIISAILLVVAVVAVVLCLTMCGSDDEGNMQDSGDGNSGDENVSTETDTYTISVKTQGGMALSELDVYVYTDDSLADLQNFAATDENGIVTFTLPKSDKYAIAISGAPKGYEVAESYSFDGNTAVITLNSSVITGDDISAAKLGLGDVMYDFTVTSVDGETVTLSELLKEKKMVLINFWFTTCTYCVEEFPYMEEAYQQYKDDIAIVALNPYQEGTEAVKGFRDNMGLSFYVAECPMAWSSGTFGITGYPTSIIVDQYGVICVIEAGGITSLRPFISAFEHFTAEDYEQKICVNGIGDLVTNVKPTYTMPTSDEIAETINSGDINVTYRAETEDDNAEYIWPFVIGEKNGEKCIYASNQQIDGSSAILYMDVELKAGQAVGFDYLSSTERGTDIMYVIVNDEAIYNISGADDVEKWKTCYPCVAAEDGTYEIALCYIKDDGDNVGDDTVYVKNMRVVNADDVDSATYIPREAATTTDGFEYTYVDIVYNENDGYYHVGSANGPLLLANLMGYTQFNEEETVFDITYDSDYTVDGKTIYELIVDYCSYASNSTLNGFCTVNKELAEILKEVDKLAGFDDEDENEWLKICKYYQAYGTDGEQLEDPIKGLAPFSAFEAKLGKDVATNYFYYDRAIIPRGLIAEFRPTKSGVYRITSKSDYEQGLDSWIFDENRNELLAYEHDERMFEDMDNVSMVFYMEAGKSYYIDIAFWDVYATGYIYYDIEYLGAELDFFRLCSPGYFTYDSDATGNEMYHVIAGGIDVILGTDGKYYEDLGKDANGNQLYGSLIYADFTGTTGIFDKSISGAMIDLGGFDFSKTEEDLYVLSVMEKHDNDIEATDAYLKEYWGEDYEGNAKNYQIEDVFDGIYHGDGEDLTAEIKTYLDDMDNSNTERQGCVVVTERLAEILQMLMDKYTFEDVDNSWIKLCYYYDYLGPEN